MKALSNVEKSQYLVRSQFYFLSNLCWKGTLVVDTAGSGIANDWKIT